jgi:hypothetical protein
MHHRSLLGTFALAAVLAVGCSGSSQNPAAPTSTPADSGDAAADGSTLKVSAPTPVSPINDVRLTNRQPTLQITNAQGRFAGGTFGYEFAVLDMTGRVVRSTTVAGGNGSTGWLYPVGDELQGNARYQWRARAVLDGAHGPWSSMATFQTVSAPPNCGFVDPWWQSREACAQTIAATSIEWRACQTGNHVACHRFTREVASALAMGDPNWGLLGKSPGVQQCTMDRCGALGGEGFGEDIVAYCRNPATCRNRFGPDGRNDYQSIDIIEGAGGPSPKLSWGAVESRNNRGNNFWAPIP